jgi:inositol phosphorylceramide synthase regulatory subunit
VQEDGNRTMLYAHLYALDHLLATSWTVFFAVVWWFFVPHDGRRVANSDAQKDMMDGDAVPLNPEERVAAAQAVWRSERGFSAAVLISGWFLKVWAS